MKNNDKGEQIWNVFFDLYMQNVVAPPHLSTGVGKRLIKVCFLQLGNLGYQKYLDGAPWEHWKEWGSHIRT